MQASGCILVGNMARQERCDGAYDPLGDGRLGGALFLVIRVVQANLPAHVLWSSCFRDAAVRVLMIGRMIPGRLWGRRIER